MLVEAQAGAQRVVAIPRRTCRVPGAGVSAECPEGRLVEMNGPPYLSRFSSPPAGW